MAMPLCKFNSLTNYVNSEKPQHVWLCDTESDLHCGLACETKCIYSATCPSLITSRKVRKRLAWLCYGSQTACTCDVLTISACNLLLSSPGIISSVFVTSNFSRFSLDYLLGQLLTWLEPLLEVIISSIYRGLQWNVTRLHLVRKRDLILGIFFSDVDIPMFQFWALLVCDPSQCAKLFVCVKAMNYLRKWLW